MSDDFSFRFNTGPDHITGPDTHVTSLVEADYKPNHHEFNAVFVGIQDGQPISQHLHLTYNDHVTNYLSRLCPFGIVRPGCRRRHGA